MNPVLEKILQNIEKVPPLPSIVMKILSVMRNPEPSIKNIIAVVQLDEVLTFRVIRMANSAYYKRSGEDVRTVGEALIRLGNNTLINMVIAESCSQYYESAGTGYDLKRGELWRHSIATALVSQKLAEKTQFEHKEALFTSCIMHDVGKTLLDSYMSTKRAEILSKLALGTVTFTQAEMEIMGFSHGEIGARLLERWGFPQDMISAVRHHHEPERALSGKKLAYHVYLSDVICLMMGIGLDLGGLSYTAQKDIFDMFNLSEADVQMLFIYLVEELAKTEEMIRG
ncbi:MAG: hypothetical protein A2268_02345 [Candidatus Raymondbacteria bacterium RifOxyA12_full_50_37]|uniref:HDOD domain-containing protein n=1 Tax=Candidatus Raymondbacteria bacterium RIFOXYD12_FULL_49_13 TaxID=1817890 RepID=A0A1F7FM08_UNCRA|nr:MAG: hypothetical protein A2248_15920 [Candidatus Raymondbacteria bacterium RIFOXYA2_FULL_49_16]OGJ90592.1 MAG: hypothetical protein A2268_02345 [Candidatus Raymondbacteria bacterium RifOxyA12_full_50_37]OGJ98721.1 MAG: hypothetical protein A2487_16020 [Candidatus Raymondbacteria bacterium RifOxyC12_full_50_8]OGJ99415.1 MAG: hypothetical protein A2453_05360 [Candidatus Raymondbacteria bacterium RIFOXYC2_FULL_50_21]OGK07536.1 MAG: hypothetical protein A2519_01625 [Candidatus Raymondbacteria b